MAIVFAVIASGCFATGATLQHLGVERNFAAEGTEDRALTFKRLLRLLVTPMWIGGLALIATGAGLHVVGLSMAPLTVIQPVGILAVPFSILLATRIHHTTTNPTMWGGVAVTVLGIVAFTYLSARSTTHGQVPHWAHLLTASGVVWGIAALLALLAWKSPQTLKCMLWALAGAGLYGQGSAYIKILTVEFPHITGANFLLSAALLAASYGVGGWMIQQGYASGPAPIVVGCMTTFDPIVAVAFGLIVLREGGHATWFYTVGMALGAIAAVAGVFVLSKYHPDALAREAQSQSVESGEDPDPEGETA